jgi:hypothetical protein
MGVLGWITAQNGYFEQWLPSLRFIVSELRAWTDAHQSFALRFDQ